MSLMLSERETKRILGQFSPEFLLRMRDRFLIEQVQAALEDGSEEIRKAYADGLVPAKSLARYVFEKTGVIVPIGGGAAGFYITNAEAISMLTDHGVGIDAGTAAVINIYDGSAPADADASEANTLLAQLTCSATAFTSVADDTPGAIATFDTISDDSSANATGTATHFRILTQNAGTATDQGTVGTSSADLILNTTSITSGSTVSITAATILLPEGP